MHVLDWSVCVLVHLGGLETPKHVKHIENELEGKKTIAQVSLPVTRTSIVFPCSHCVRMKPTKSTLVNVRREGVQRKGGHLAAMRDRLFI